MNETTRAVAALEAATLTAKDLSRDVADYTRVLRRVQWTLLSAFIVMAIVLISGAVVVRSTMENTQIIADCTTAGGECYARNQKRTAAILKEMDERNTKSSVYLSECARQYPNIVGPEYDVKLERCVLAKLKENRPLGTVKGTTPGTP